MNLRGFRWPRLLLSLTATFAVFAAGFALLERQSIDRPLVTALEARPDVRQVELSRQAGVAVVRVRLGRVANLQKEYEAIERAAQGVRGLGPFRLEIVDARDAGLEQALYRLHFALQEANATGRFTKLAEDVKAVAREQGIEEPRVYVSADRIYVSLYRGDHYLYEVLPRLHPAARSGEGV